MLKWLLKSLLKSLLILIALVVASATLPFASFWLCRNPVGAQVFFWVAPWTCAFWTLLASVLIGSRFWRGAESVKAWRAARGGFLKSHLKSTGLMFAGLFLSYGCEFAFIFLVPPSPSALQLLPIVSYAPVALAVLWAK